MVCSRRALTLPEPPRSPVIFCVRGVTTRPCDVDENNPPAGFVPLIEIAKTGTLVDRFFVPQLNDKDLARGPTRRRQRLQLP